MALGKSLAMLLLSGMLFVSSYLIKVYSDEIRKIYLVPGHDSRECSRRAVGKAGREDELAIKFASKLEKKLKEKDKDLTVIRTRNSEGYSKDLIKFVKKDLNKSYLDIDYFSLLEEEAKYINHDSSGSLVLNIHFDKVDYDICKIKGFSFIYDDENPKICESIQLAFSESRAFIKNGLKPSNNYDSDDGITMGRGFHLIGKTNAPTLIIEFDSIDNEKLNDPNYRDKLLNAACEGAIDYKKNHKHLQD
jgi:N-acetylmuramoyl-L-alanine amidase